METLFDKIQKEIPLELRLNVLNEMMLQTYLIDNGFISDGYWDDEKERKYGKGMKDMAMRMTEAELETINKWESDGRPDKSVNN